MPMEISSAKGRFEISRSGVFFTLNQKSYKQNNREKRNDFKDARGTFRTQSSYLLKWIFHIHLDAFIQLVVRNNYLR